MSNSITPGSIKLPLTIPEVKVRGVFYGRRINLVARTPAGNMVELNLSQKQARALIAECGGGEV